MHHVLELISAWVDEDDPNTATLLAQDYFAGVLGRGEPVGAYKYESYDPEQIGSGAPALSMIGLTARSG